MGRFRTDIRDSKVDDDIIETDEHEYEKKQAELIGEKVEKRLIKVLGSFLKGDSENEFILYGF